MFPVPTPGAIGSIETPDEEVRSLGFGAGMGLPNMKRYSDEFFIESQPGQGTTIRMNVLL